MKKILLIFALAAFTTGFTQENKNTKKETIVTKKSVTSDLGVDVSTTAETKTQKQIIKLDQAEANMTNQNMVMSPTVVNTDINYSYDGNRFKFLNQKDEKGYRLMTVKDNATEQEYAIIKPSTQNGYYILSKDGTSSFGYFNEDGNFVVERYDANLDAVVSDIYKMEIKKD